MCCRRRITGTWYGTRYHTGHAFLFRLFSVVMIPPVARSGSMLQFAKLLCFRRRCCWLPSRYLLLLNTSNEGKAVLFFFFRTSMHSPKIPSIAVTCYQVVSKISLGGSSTRSCRTHAITSIAFYENKHARWSALPGIMPSHTPRGAPYYSYL